MLALSAQKTLFSLLIYAIIRATVYCNKIPFLVIIRAIVYGALLCTQYCFKLFTCTVAFIPSRDPTRQARHDLHRRDAESLDHQHSTVAETHQIRLAPGPALFTTTRQLLHTANEAGPVYGRVLFQT